MAASVQDFRLDRRAVLAECAPARSRAARPLSVSDSLRVVRVSSVVRSRVSKRVTARETVALVRPRSRAASENEPHSATLEKIAQASKSGSCCIRRP
jgi:hypothetical protein